MKYSELKKKISEDFEKETPDVLDKIKEKTANEAILPAPTLLYEERKERRVLFSYKYLAAASLIIVLMMGILIGSLIKRDTGYVYSDSSASVFIDVNPSVEMCITAAEELKAVWESMKMQVRCLRV